MLTNPKALSVCCLVPHSTGDRWWQRYVETPEGQPLRAEWLWGHLAAPLQAWRRYVSTRLTVDIISVSERLAFEHESGVELDGARHASAVVVFSRTKGNP